MSKAERYVEGGGHGGHLYMQTNEIRNAIVHYRWSTSGTLTEVERIPTGGAGSGTFKPISGQESAPNAFEGAASVILTADRRFLFTTNGGDNSVSSFSVDKDGRLTLLDVKPTGNPVEGKSGTAKSLAYAPSKRIALRAALVRPRPSPADVGRRRRQAHTAPGAIYGEYERQDRPCAHHGCTLAQREIPPCGHHVRRATRFAEAFIQTAHLFSGSRSPTANTR